VFGDNFEVATASSINYIAIVVETAATVVR
jgi:hypothetical protein